MRRETIERLLPGVYQRAAEPGSPLSAVLDVMAGLHEPDERLLSAVDDLFAPYRTTEPLIRYLTGWVSLGYLLGADGGADGGANGWAPLPIPPARLRNLVAESPRLARWRGTPGGLRWFLEIATGVNGFVVEEPVDRAFHFVLHVPPQAEDQLGVIRRIVAMEKPAAATYEIVMERAG
jgi:hypothetical protein